MEPVERRITRCCASHANRGHDGVASYRANDVDRPRTGVACSSWLDGHETVGAGGRAARVAALVSCSPARLVDQPTVEQKNGAT